MKTKDSTFLIYHPHVATLIHSQECSNHRVNNTLRSFSKDPNNLRFLQGPQQSKFSIDLRNVGKLDLEAIWLKINQPPTHR